MISEGQRLKKIRDAELRRKDREVLRHLREQIRTHGAKRRARLAEIRAHCQAARAALRARARELRARLRSRIARLRAEQCSTCKTDRARASGELKAELARLRAELAAEVRAYRERYVKRSSSSARVREQESADEVAQNLPPELVAVWRVMQSKIKGSARRSRTEAFLDWAEENPDAT